jgi:hypothetical protein
VKGPGVPIRERAVTRGLFPACGIGCGARGRSFRKQGDDLLTRDADCYAAAIQAEWQELASACNYCALYFRTGVWLDY